MIKQVIEIPCSNPIATIQKLVLDVINEIRKNDTFEIARLLLHFRKLWIKLHVSHFFCALKTFKSWLISIHFAKYTRIEEKSVLKIHQTINI